MALADGIKSRPPQTKVKHTILEEYLTKWGGIIIQGRRTLARRQGTPFTLHLVYVDCNASWGRYSGEKEDDKAKGDKPIVFGSPIIGIRVLDELAVWAQKEYGLHVRRNAILIEQDTKRFAELGQSLYMAGYRNRAFETDAFTILQDGELALLNTDSTTIAPQLVAYTQRSNSTFAFFFLDPYGPLGIPLRFVREIIRHPRHDVIINMPYRDLHKKKVFVGRANLNTDQQNRIRYYNEMFGHSSWQDIVQRLDTELVWDDEETSLGAAQSVDAARLEAARVVESELIQCYRESLQGIDADLAVKSIGLHQPHAAQTMFYLYLTTHDANGALAMNKLLWDAELQEHELRWRLRDAVQVHKKGYERSLFDLPVPEPKNRTRTSTTEIAERIVQLLSGRLLELRHVYRALADELYFDDEIKKALSYLRSNGRAFYDGDLRNHTRIRIGKT